jgi:hypothetical protein
MLLEWPISFEKFGAFVLAANSDCAAVHRLLNPTPAYNLWGTFSDGDFFLINGAFLLQNPNRRIRIIALSIA